MCVGLDAGSQFLVSVWTCVSWNSNFSLMSCDLHTFYPHLIDACPACWCTSCSPGDQICSLTFFLHTVLFRCREQALNKPVSLHLMIGSCEKRVIITYLTQSQSFVWIINRKSNKDLTLLHPFAAMIWYNFRAIMSAFSVLHKNWPQRATKISLTSSSFADKQERQFHFRCTSVWVLLPSLEKFHKLNGQ